MKCANGYNREGDNVTVPLRAWVDKITKGDDEIIEVIEASMISLLKLLKIFV